MIKYITAIFIALAPAANAQQNETVEVVDVLMPIVCTVNGIGYLNNVTMQYSEKPLFTSKTAHAIVTDKAINLEGTLVTLVNQQTRTLTVVVVYPDGSLCELAAGIEFEPYVD